MADTREESIARLRASLPSLPAALDDPDVEIRARAVLGYAIAPTSEFAPTEEDPTRCPNCSGPVESLRSPYCGERCREMAGFVRQFRSGLQLGWIFDDQKQVALGQVLWHVLGGGRPLRREIAPKRAVETAFKREGGICQVCGATATTIDHQGSGCNRPINLRVVCETCCEDRPFGDESVMSRPEAMGAIKDIAARIQSDTPLKCCDDAETWNWRAYIAKRC